MKYILEIMYKRKALVMGAGLVVAGMFWLFSQIQTFTSTTTFRFQVTDTGSTSLRPSMQIDGILGKSDSLMDRTFLYLNSSPFYMELAQNLIENDEGSKFLTIFSRSKNSYLLKFKGLFFDTFTYEGPKNKELEITQTLQKIISFKKIGDNAIGMFVKTGDPHLSVELGSYFSPIVKQVIVKNESYDVKTSANHLNQLLLQSQENIKRFEAQLLNQKKNLVVGKTGDGTPTASIEMEKELRMANIEVQRIDLLIQGIEDGVKSNSTYSTTDGQYEYIDQISMERLNELKQQREVAVAKAKSVENTFLKVKSENRSIPANEQRYQNVRWHLELEQAINKDLILKARDLDGMIKVLENSVRVVGQTVLAPTMLKVSRFMKVVLGFLIGSFLSMIGVYYFFDFFKVIKGNFDLRSFGPHEIINSIPMLEMGTDKMDIWKDLPENHHAMESFRHIMEKSISAKIVSFLSSDKGEGKSFVVANLAENLSRFGKKVLVVDTNWKNPTLSQTFQNNSKIKVIPAGQFQHGKDAFLNRSLLIKEIKKVSAEFDVILIDTQNLSESNDGLVVASVSDLSIMVASYLETYHHKFSNGVKKLEAAGIKDFCFLLNKANLNNEILTFRGNVRALDDIDPNIVYFKKSS